MVLHANGEWWNISYKMGVYAKNSCDTVKMTVYSNGSPYYDWRFKVLSVTGNTLQIQKLVWSTQPQPPTTYTRQ